MSLDELRRNLNALWASANREAEEFKDPFIALERVKGMYRGLSTSDRELADQVLGEWLMSDDEAKRYDADVLVSEFRVTSAAPALRQLTRKLAGSDDPGAPFEREKVEATLRALES